MRALRKKRKTARGSLGKEAGKRGGKSKITSTCFLGKEGGPFNLTVQEEDQGGGGQGKILRREKGGGAKKLREGSMPTKERGVRRTHINKEAKRQKTGKKGT